MYIYKWYCEGPTVMAGSPARSRRARWGAGGRLSPPSHRRSLHCTRQEAIFRKHILFCLQHCITFFFWFFLLKNSTVLTTDASESYWAGPKTVMEQRSAKDCGHCIIYRMLNSEDVTFSKRVALKYSLSRIFYSVFLLWVVIFLLGIYFYLIFLYDA